MQKHSNSLEQKAALRALIDAVEEVPPAIAPPIEVRSLNDAIETEATSLNKRRRSLD